MQTALTNYTVGAEIMGKSFIGIPEGMKLFKDRQLPVKTVAFLSGIPYSAEKLEEHRDTDVLIAMLPVSIGKMREYLPDRFYPAEKEIVPWFGSHALATEQVGPQWLLVPKSMLVSEDGDNVYSPDSHKALRVSEIAYAAIAWSIKTGKPMNLGGASLSCADEALPDHHVYVAAVNNGSSGITVNSGPKSGMRTAFARKPDIPLKMR